MPPADQFATIITQASVGIAKVDLDGHFSLVNDAYCRIAGRSESELLALRMQDITHPDDLPHNLELLQRCVGEGRDFKIEKRYVRPDGSTVWVENAVSLLRGRDGAPEAILAVSHDIGRRKAAEAEVIEAEERYRLIGRATNDVIWDWNHRTGLVVWSESLRTVFGYRAAEANGPFEQALGWWGDRIHPDERQAVLDSFTAAARGSGETWAKEYRFRAADGGYRHVIDRGYIVRHAGGEPTRMVGSMQDVTELQAERRKLETILQQLPVGVIVADASGRLVFGNAQVARIWRHPFVASASIEEYAHWKGYHPDGRPLRAEEWPLARALLHGEVVAEQVIHFDRGDGSGRGVMQVSASPIDDPGGGRAGAAVVFTDVTDRERLYELARAAQRDAEAASRMKDEFLAVLSHELRTPLNAILGWTHMLASQSVPPDRIPHVVGVIQRNARAQAQMVEDLLDVSAIIRGKLRLHTGPVDLGAVVAAAVESVRLQADEKQIALRTTIDPDAASGHGDPARLQQIVWNLLSNAIKFTPAGGRVAVELRRPDAAHVEIVVRDSGRGIDPAFLPHVFDRFRQGDATPTRVHGGLGLGLSIVRHLVEAHGGAVRAESDGLDKGAAFIVTLPVAPVRAAAAEPAVPVVADLLDGVGVLLVEIGAAAAEDIAADLTRRGARLTRVDSVAVALQVIERERPALIVAAIPHPERDGHELIEAVRRLPGSRRIPALAITPVASVTHHHAALAAGFDRHLSRPVDPAELAAIAAALARA